MVIGMHKAKLATMKYIWNWRISGDSCTCLYMFGPDVNVIVVKFDPSISIECYDLVWHFQVTVIYINLLMFSYMCSKVNFLFRYIEDWCGDGLSRGIRMTFYRIGANTHTCHHVMICLLISRRRNTHYLTIIISDSYLDYVILWCSYFTECIWLSANII